MSARPRRCESDGIEVAIDPVSLRYLTGLTLDVVEATFRSTGSRTLTEQA